MAIGRQVRDSRYVPARESDAAKRTYGGYRFGKVRRRGCHDARSTVPFSGRTRRLNVPRSPADPGPSTNGRMRPRADLQLVTGNVRTSASCGRSQSQSRTKTCPLAGVRTYPKDRAISLSDEWPTSKSVAYGRFSPPLRVGLSMLWSE